MAEQHNIADQSAREASDHAAQAADTTAASTRAGKGAAVTAGGANRRFRLPKLFADSAEGDAVADGGGDTTSAPAANLSEAERRLLATANRPFEGSPRARVLRVPPDGAAPTTPPVATPPAVATPAVSMEPAADAVSVAPANGALSSAASLDLNQAALPTSTSSTSSPASTASTASPVVEPGAASTSVAPVVTPMASLPASLPDGALLDGIQQLRDGMEEMKRSLQEVVERGSTQDKVFDTLHAELQDYKNDFIYEHLKPVVRPLLFLFDSLEQFDREMAQEERPVIDERRQGLSPHRVRENVSYFLEQLIEALRICEVTPMQTPQGEFDARLQKAVETVPVEAEHDNVIQRVVRSGWYLNGRVFRPAEVVLGKKNKSQ